MKDTNDTDLEDLAAPSPFPGTNRRLVLGTGAPISPLVRLSTFSDEEFENVTLAWVHECLFDKYCKVRLSGGAGDKGRDVVAWIDRQGVTPRRWDNYQCKHYKDPLAPSVFDVELGKLCYYTFIKDYTIPEHYYIVTHKNIGPKLMGLLEKSDGLRDSLIANWDSRCRDKITQRKSISLNGEFRQYVEAFDFSIVENIPPQTLIDQFSKTKYYDRIFGTIRRRPEPQLPPPTFESKETRYIEQIFEAFSEYLKKSIEDEGDFSHCQDLQNFFKHARVCFYSAESLSEFSRDTLPDESYFIELMKQFLDGLFFVLSNPYTDGYHKMRETCTEAMKIQIDSHALREEIVPNDRVGICHQLANEDEIRWAISDKN